MAANTRTSPEVRSLRAKAAAGKRWGRPDADDLQRQARTELLAEHIRRVVDQAPPLTAEQRTRLAALLLGPDSGGHR